MKFRCSQQELSKALNIVSKAVSVRTTIPVLKGILIKADKDGTITLSASDLDLSIERKMKADVESEGSIVVMSKLFGDIVRKLPAETIDVEEKENNNVRISTPSSDFTIVGFSADEFPETAGLEGEENQISFNKDIFRDMVKKTSFAASIDESKGIITGVLIDMREDYIAMVATDGFRMAVARENVTNKEEKSMIISARILNEINKIITEDDDEDENIMFRGGNKKAVITLKNTVITFRLLEGKYLDYKNILPKEYKCEVKAQRKDLSDSIERASLLAKEGKNNLIRIKITDGTLVITSRSEEGNVFESVNVEKTGDDIEIGFNSKYMLDALRAADEETVRLELTSSVSPCMIKPSEGNHFEYLVLPVRITVQ